jgi:hypothetical protein
MPLFIALQWLDFLTTILGFSLGCSEASPIVRGLMPVIGPTLAVFVTKVLTVLAMWRISKKTAMIYAGNLWYLAIVAWNVFVILSISAFPTK